MTSLTSYLTRVRPRIRTSGVVGGLRLVVAVVTVLWVAHEARGEGVELPSAQVLRVDTAQQMALHMADAREWAAARGLEAVFNSCPHLGGDARLVRTRYVFKHDAPVLLLDLPDDLGDFQRWANAATTTTTAGHPCAPDGWQAPRGAEEPLEEFQWQFTNNGPTGHLCNPLPRAVPGADANLTEAQQLVGPKRSEVIVAVIDSGLGPKYSFPDERDLPALWTNPRPRGVFDEFYGDYHGWNFADGTSDISDGDDRSWHGTRVASVIAAPRNQYGMLGVAPNARIMVLRVRQTGPSRPTDFAIACAMSYAVRNGAHIINLSSSFKEPSRHVREALEYAGAEGVLVVAAVPNSATAHSLAPSYPATFGGRTLISVAATNAADRQMRYTAYDTSIDLTAPGQDILTLSPFGYWPLTGTSFAAPIVAGTAALIASGEGAYGVRRRANGDRWVLDRGWAARMRTNLIDSSHRLDQLLWCVRAGRLDAAAAVHGVRLSPPNTWNSADATGHISTGDPPCEVRVEGASRIRLGFASVMAESPSWVEFAKPGSQPLQRQGVFRDVQGLEIVGDSVQVTLNGSGHVQISLVEWKCSRRRCGPVWLSCESARGQR